MWKLLKNPMWEKLSKGLRISSREESSRFRRMKLQSFLRTNIRSSKLRKSNGLRYCLVLTKETLGKLPMRWILKSRVSKFDSFHDWILKKKKIPLVLKRLKVRLDLLQDFSLIRWTINSQQKLMMVSTNTKGNFSDEDSYTRTFHSSYLKLTISFLIMIQFKNLLFQKTMI